MDAREFTTRPVNVLAMQVTSADAATEIVRWVEENGGQAWDNTRYRPGRVAESAGVQVRGADSQKRNAEEGSWVVLMNGEFRIFTDEFFTRSFDSVPERAKRGSTD